MAESKSPTLAPEKPPKTLRDHALVLRRHLWLIVATMVLAIAVAVALSATQKKSYTATATINFVDPLSNSGIVVGGGSTQLPANLAAAGNSQLTQTSTLQRVRRRLLTNLSIHSLKKAISTTTDPTTYLVTVTATGSDPAFAAALANTDVQVTKSEQDRASAALFARLAQNYSAQLKSLSPSQQKNGSVVSDLYDNLSRAQTLARTGATAAQITSTAQPPTSPSSPKPVENGIIAGVLGLVLGLVIAGVRESFDRRLGGPRDIESRIGLPLVGQVREGSLGKIKVADGSVEIDALDLEAFRILRTNLEFLDAANPPRVVIVTSARPEEGKTTVATSLAFASAVAGRRTLLVECDLRRPQFSSRLGIKSSPGLVDFLMERSSPRDVLQTLPIGVRAGGSAVASVDGRLNGHPPPGVESSQNGAPEESTLGSASRLGILACVSAGTRAPHPPELLASNRFHDFLSEVREVYDLVVFDTSPLLPVADTLELVPAVDAVLLCVRASRTTREEAQAAKTALERFPARPMGIVVTGVRDRHEAGGYYYPYRYGYSYVGSPEEQAATEA